MSRHTEKVRTFLMRQEKFTAEEGLREVTGDLSCFRSRFKLDKVESLDLARLIDATIIFWYLCQ